MYETKILYDPANIEIETTNEEDNQTTEENQQIVILSTEDLNVEYITTEGQIIDTRLYLSSEVSGADLNDVYSMLLSIRNLFVLFMLIFIFFKIKNIIHSVLAKIFDNGK